MSKAADLPGGGARPARPSGTTDVTVWDPLVRLIHWGLAGTILVNGVFTNPEHKTHEIVGYVAVALVALRLVWGLIGTRHARFSAFPPNPVAAVRHLRQALAGQHKVHLSHNPAGALMVYNLWATVIAMGITGYMMGTVSFFGLRWVKDLHEALFNWLMLSVALHLAGVLLDSWLTRVPLVRAMIDGRKRLPGDRTGGS